MDFKLIFVLGLVIVIILAILSLGFLSPSVSSQANKTNAEATAVILDSSSGATATILGAAANATKTVRESCQGSQAYADGCLPAGTKLVEKSQGVPPYVYFCGGLLIVILIAGVSGTRFG